MSDTVHCGTCTAPVSIYQNSRVLTCDHCGATMPLPAGVATNPQWIRHCKQKEIEAWYAREREPLLVTNSVGVKEPPSRASFQGVPVFMGFAALGFVSTAVLAVASIVFFPLVALTPFTFFGFPLIGMIWGGKTIVANQQRYRSYTRLAAEYERRINALFET